MGLTRLSIERPLAVLMAIAALLLLGWRALIEMPAELDPKVDIPTINVMTVYPGAGPEEIEQQVSKPLEDALGSIGNVTSVSSRSLENISFVTISLKLGTNIDTASADLRARIEAVRNDLPEDIRNPQISKVDLNSKPVLVLGVTGERTPEQLYRLVDEQIRPRLGQVAGLGNVSVVGGRQREVHIAVDPERLNAYGLSLLDLLRPLKLASQSVPAGSVAQGGRDISIRVLGEFGSLQDLLDTPIPVGGGMGGMNSQAAMMAMGGGGATSHAGGAARPATLRLRDLAKVELTTAEQEQITRVGRKESIGLILTRLPTAHTVRVADGVKEALADLKDRLPRDVRITTLQDHSQTVSDALEDINFTLILGSILAVAVVLVFLHSIKDTLIVALAIPTSIISTFLVMYFAGFSLNQMTMLALSLSVGILVDDSILVLECIHRHRAMGKEPKEAALDGRKEIGLADAANTFVDIVVFLPIAFMGGIVGQFFREFGLTIATATLASLYVSFSVTPMLAAWWFKKGEEVPGTPGARKTAFATWFDARYDRLERFYRSVLAMALRRRLMVVGFGFGALIAVGFLAFQMIGFDFTPSVDRGQVSVQIETPPGASLEATDAVMRKIEAEAIKIPEVDPDRMLASVGEIIGGFGSLPDRGPQFGQLTLMLIEKQGFLDKITHPFGQAGRRQRTDEDVATDLRKALQGLPGADQISVNAVRGMTAALAPIQLGLYSNDMAELERVSGQVRDKLAKLPQLQNVDSTLRRGKPEIQLVLDRDAAEAEMVTASELAGVMRTAIAGNTDLRYRSGSETLPIRLMLARTGPEDPRRGPEALKSLIVANRGMTPVEVGDIADVRLGAGPTKILRRNRVRRAIISAHVQEGVSLGSAQAAVDAAVADVKLGSVQRVWEGDVEDMTESAGLMAGALILATLLSYMLMAALFNSLHLPITILASLPMALVGGLLGLIYTGTTMNIVSMIGIVMLVGLVSKNAILLVDYTNTLRQEGMARDDAIRAAAPVRLRPILMTTISTVLGMTPVALQIGRASEMRAPMAIVVIGGLLLSTLLTLLVIPVMYTYMDDFGSGVIAAWKRVTSPQEKPEKAPRAQPEIVPNPEPVAGVSSAALAD